LKDIFGTKSKEMSFSKGFKITFVVIKKTAKEMFFIQILKPKLFSHQNVNFVKKSYS
jgi:hypothetical protein